jgi:hypothetical protein
MSFNWPPRYRKRPSLVAHRTGYPPCLPKIATPSLAIDTVVKKLGKIIPPASPSHRPSAQSPAQTAFCQ